MKQKQVLFVTAECQNFAQTGGLAEVAGSLPKAINALSRAYKVRVIMPLYRAVIKNTKKLKFLGSTTVALAWRNLYCGVYTLKQDGSTITSLTTSIISTATRSTAIAMTASVSPFSQRAYSTSSRSSACS